MAVKRYDGSAWQTVAGLGAQGPAGADGSAPLTTKGDILTRSSTTTTRLGVGTNGQILVADSAETTGLKWGTGGLTYINTLTLSSTGTGGATIDNVFTSTYENYRIVFYTTSNSGTTTNLAFQLRASGTTTTSNYKSQYGSLESTTWSTGVDALGTDEWYIGNNYSAQVNMVTVLDIAAPQLASRTFFLGMASEFNTTTGVGLRVNSGMQSDSTQFDGFLIRPSTGTLSGKAAIYGYAKS